MTWSMVPVRLGKALRFLRKKEPFARSHGENHVAAQVQKANRLAKRGQFAEAEGVLTEAAADQPDHPAPLEALARVAKRQRNWYEVLRRWRLLAERHPNHVGARIQLAETHIKLHQPQQAKAELAEALAHWPEHIGARIAMANVLLQLGQVAEAEELLAGIESRSPDNPALMEVWAYVSEHRQRWPEALGRWQALTEQHGDRTGLNARTHTALCLFKLGRIEEARSLVAEIVGFKEERPVFNDLFGPCAPMVSYYGRQIEDTFRNVT